MMVIISSFRKHVFEELKQKIKNQQMQENLNLMLSVIIKPSTIGRTILK